LEPGVCGERGWCGVLMSSVDQVGRYFPLIIASELPGGCTPLRAAVAGAGWFGRAQALALDCLQNEALDLDVFDESVAALGFPLADAPSLKPESLPELGVAGGLRVALDVHGVPGLLQRVVDSSAPVSLTPASLWWCEGSEQVEPSLLWHRGLPPAAAFASLLTGAWRAEHWAMAPAVAHSPPVIQEALSQ
jgi:type VI secretion system protein ImpM